MNINLQKFTATLITILLYILILIGTIYATGALESHAIIAFLFPCSFLTFGLFVTLKSIWRTQQ